MVTGIWIPSTWLSTLSLHGVNWCNGWVFKVNALAHSSVLRHGWVFQSRWFSAVTGYFLVTLRATNEWSTTGWIEHGWSTWSQER